MAPATVSPFENLPTSPMTIVGKMFQFSRMLTKRSSTITTVHEVCAAKNLMVCCEVVRRSSNNAFNTIWLRLTVVDELKFVDRQHRHRAIQLAVATKLFLIVLFFVFLLQEMNHSRIKTIVVENDVRRAVHTTEVLWAPSAYGFPYRWAISRRSAHSQQ